MRIEFYVGPNGVAPAEVWLEQLSRGSQQKFAALFVRMGDTRNMWNERKFKHVTEQIRYSSLKSTLIASCASSSSVGDSF